MADIYDYIKELTKFELEFEDDHDRIYSLRSYIKSLDEDKILIDPPSHKGITYNIPNGQPIRMIICAEDGVYLGESDVIGKQLTDISGLWISYPSSSHHVQRREYLRVAINIDMTLVVYQDKEKTQKKEIKVQTRNISGKGFSYISDEPITNYYDIECRFHLNDGISEPVVASCEHIYSVPNTSSGKLKYVNAFAYVDLDNRSTERIVKECFKFQLELRRKGLL